MAMNDRITLTGEHGTYQTRAISLDQVIDFYLPSSAGELRNQIRERISDTEEGE